VEHYELEQAGSMMSNTHRKEIIITYDEHYELEQAGSMMSNANRGTL
jgi:hypothetical protein